MNEHATNLRRTRANMLGTEDDEVHFHHCHEAAAEIDRLEAEARTLRNLGVATYAGNEPIVELRSLQLAYLAALTMPHGVRRIQLQSLLAALLHEIAEISGQEPELIQNAHEAVFSLTPRQDQ